MLVLAAQGGILSWKGHPSIVGHVHTPHSGWDKLDMPIHATCMSLQCGRKTILEKTHADIWRMCKLYTDSGLSRQLTFFPHPDKMTLNKMILLEDCCTGFFVNVFS